MREYFIVRIADNVRRTFESGQVVTMTEDKFWENPDINKGISIITPIFLFAKYQHKEGCHHPLSAKQAL